MKISSQIGNIINTGHPRAQGLVGCWMLNEGGGSRAIDSLKLNPIDGVVTNATYQQSEQGTCVNFNGTTGFVNMNTAASYPNLNLPGQLTIIASINPVGGAPRHIVGDCNAGATLEQYDFEVDRSVGRLSFIQGGAVVATSTGTLVSDSVWARVGVTRTGGTGAWTIKFYINGLLDTTISAIATNPSAQQGMSIGRLGNFNGQYFSGQINKVYMYNRALTDSEMMADFINPYAIFI